jgi:hypothetical protein
VQGINEVIKKECYINGVYTRDKGKTEEFPMAKLH